MKMLCNQTECQEEECEHMDSHETQNGGDGSVECRTPCSYKGCFCISASNTNLSPELRDGIFEAAFRAAQQHRSEEYAQGQIQERFKTRGSGPVFDAFITSAITWVHRKHREQCGRVSIKTHNAYPDMLRSFRASEEFQ